jgi:hypothetical protein
MLAARVVRRNPETGELLTDKNGRKASRKSSRTHAKRNASAKRGKSGR